MHTAVSGVSKPNINDVPIFVSNAILPQQDAIASLSSEGDLTPLFNKRAFD